MWSHMSRHIRQKRPLVGKPLGFPTADDPLVQSSGCGWPMCCCAGTLRLACDEKVIRVLGNLSREPTIPRRLWPVVSTACDRSLPSCLW